MRYMNIKKDCDGMSYVKYHDVHARIESRWTKCALHVWERSNERESHD